MLADLLATEGVREHCELNSSIGFMALHGGLEATTFEIAAESARRSGASLYGVVQPEQLTWHVPSHRFDPSESQALSAFCAHVDTAISIHGYGGIRDHPNRWLTISLGGGGRSRAAIVGGCLREHLADYEIVDEIDDIPRQYRGLHARNPVNLVKSAGVQIELPPRVRGTSPVWADHDFDTDPLVPHTYALIEALVQAVALLDQTRPGTAT
ncbi:MAG: poly-gamma-glutamate hydrolase family protein [Microthrixaceae bacterium]